MHLTLHQSPPNKKCIFILALFDYLSNKFHFNISDFLLHKACFFGQRQHLSVCRCGTSFICSGIHPKHSPVSVEMSVEIISLHLGVEPLAWNWEGPTWEGKTKNHSKGWSKIDQNYANTNAFLSVFHMVSSRVYHVKDDARVILKLKWFSMLQFFKPELCLLKVGSSLNKKYLGSGSLKNMRKFFVILAECYFFMPRA